jgi:hypothetical protein
MAVELSKTQRLAFGIQAAETDEKYGGRLTTAAASFSCWSATSGLARA